ncbi:MAG TPA: hypothetical protein VE220_05375, partial [Gaiellaceae bacterium]|nr:hypothetical protein [Gaiellaceae bacterium]
MEPTASVRTRAVVVAVLLPIVGLATACGGSGHDATSAAQPTTAPTTTQAAPTAAAAAPPHEFPEFRVAMDEATD